MKVLVIGSGGREHALAWKISLNPKVKKIYCAPGNAGISEIAECVNISATDVQELLDFALNNSIDLTVVGPESSLVEGIVDVFRKHKLRIFGPEKKGAILEGSKVFTKQFFQRHNIPTASFQVFTDRTSAHDYIKTCEIPVVVKADGLAAGKGVIVAKTRDEAHQAVDLIMFDKAFGDAGKTIVIEDCLVGEEASFIAFTDGKTVLPMPTSQDHKAIYDYDLGPNTGGMGAYSPAPIVTPELTSWVMEKILLPTVKGLQEEGIDYRGILYAGLMITEKDIYTLEYNCRFGDPEAQPLLMRLKTDLVTIMEAVIDRKLHEITMDIDPRPAVCVVMASGGYPGKFEKGHKISGLKAAATVPGVQVFHAGTEKREGKFVNSGGRVLSVTALHSTLAQAITTAYEAVHHIKWHNAYFRKDIGAKALRRQEHCNENKLVGILMGSDSDLPVMQAAADFLKKMGVPYEMTVASAHRTPERATSYAKNAKQNGLKILIAGAGMAAHLAGVIASHTDLPVIGVPLDASPLQGMDALLATVQMPPGIPVATMGIGKAGAKNAAVLACRILALYDEALAGRLEEFKQEMIVEVEEKAKKIASC